MIYQYTGQPGHGKTLHALLQALEFKDEGRVVYACNVRDLDYQKSGLLPMTPEQFRDWPNFLPDGAVALVDECYEHDMLPKLGPGMKVPHHVEQLAKHRHRGLDFIFVCQSPAKQMHTFVHDLIERHTHVRRRFGMNFVHLRIFDRYESRPEKAHPLILKRTRLPKRPQGLYKSTELDTTEKKVPWYYYAGGALVLAIAAGTAWTFWSMSEQFDSDRVTAAATAAGNGAKAKVPAGGGADGSRKSLGTPSEYAEAHLPRFGSMPWTAPVFDDRGVNADPQLFCMASSPGEDAHGARLDYTCTCLTEQGTTYDLPQADCRTLARRGPVYNPYKERRENNASQQEMTVVAPPAPADNAVAVISGDMKKIGTRGEAGNPGTAPVVATAPSPGTAP